MFSFFKRKKEKAEELRFKLTKEKFDDIFASFQKETWQETLESLTQITGDGRSAEQCYWFVPKIAFDIVLPDIKDAAPGRYKVVDENQIMKEFVFSKNPLFRKLIPYVEKSLPKLSEEEFARLMSHSGTFNAVNQALNEGEKAEGLLVESVYLTDYPFDNEE